MAQGFTRVRTLKALVIAASDESTPLVTGTAKATFRMPYSMALNAIRASVSTAQTSGSLLTIDVNSQGVSLLSTRITIDNNEESSTSAAIQPVIFNNSLPDDAEITVDIDVVGNGTAKGLKIVLLGG